MMNKIIEDIKRVQKLSFLFQEVNYVNEDMW